MANSSFINMITSGPMAVTLITTLVYLAIFIPLIIIHETVPPAPNNPVLYNGLNISEAWLDLTTLTNGFHPYNSRRNDEVRNWLLRRIEGILRDNDVVWETESGLGGQLGVGKNADLLDGRTKDFEPLEPEEALDSKHYKELKDAAAGTGGGDIGIIELRPRVDEGPLVTIFNDLQSNVTCSGLGSIGSAGQGRLPGQSVYFEGTNIIVYIRGTEDEEGEWWRSTLNLHRTHGKGGVLLNAHYDSVSTGFGATDDGVGVITILQLIRFFTLSGNRPKKGIVALFNNGEEDFLNGARAYTQHPMSLFTHTFLNLEGAGAGGRAVLFRTTDTEVTRAYAKSPNPYGTVIAADGFKQGFIKSQTDYVVFQDTLGLRGLDLAFWEPRARYHTDQDDARHTSVDSLWHMLSASLATVKELTSDTSSTFLGPRGDHARGKVNNGNGGDGVWFDLFGKTLPVFGLRTLFAWSLTLLIATPITIIVIIYLLIAHDKFYFFTPFTPHGNSGVDGELVIIHGWRGASRWPITFIVASGLTFGAALLVAKVNPLIVYSSLYALWTMMLSLYIFVFWFIMRGADSVRPSALHRGYAYMWLFLNGWAALVAATVFEDRFRIASGYIIVFYQAALFFALVISLCECFLLPRKAYYAHLAHGRQETRDCFNSLPNAESSASSEPEPATEEGEPTETTPLFGGDGAGESRTTTFANYARRSLGGGQDGAGDFIPIDQKHKPYGREQAWSGKLPQWTWLIQFLITAPFQLILIGQVGLFIVCATSQTGADGSSLTFPYLIIATFTILVIIPLTPVIHRYTYHIPTFLFLVFIGTLIYNLVAFPFSAGNRYKAFFQQTVDLDTGFNNVTIVGLEQYVRPIISTLPSAAGQEIVCESRPLRTGVTFCSFSGIPPRVVSSVPNGAPPDLGYKDWLSFKVTRQPGTNNAHFSISVSNSRAAVIRFARPIKRFSVVGAGEDDRFDSVPELGSDQVKLWHRDWDRVWEVDVEWGVGEGEKMGEEGMEGQVVGIWSDANEQGEIGALEEVRRFAPPWVAWSKLSDGLVEGGKGFIV